MAKKQWHETSAGRDAYFAANARYDSSTTNQNWRYKIRMASKVLHSSDTLDLREQMERYLTEKS